MNIVLYSIIYRFIFLLNFYKIYEKFKEII